MQISISRASLLQQIQRCQNIVEKKSTSPILSNFLLQAENGALTLMATDLQIAVISSTGVNVEVAGKITVEAKKFHDIVKELDAEKEVLLKYHNNFLEIKNGRSRFRLSTLPADDYPGMPKDETEMNFRIDAKLLAQMIAGTAFAMSNDETRKYLTGSLFEMDDSNGFKIVTTDGHRLALKETRIDQSSSPAQCIVPRKAVTEIKKVCEDYEGEVTVALGARQIRVKAGDYTLTSKIIDARFPSYLDVIPRDNPIIVTVNCNEFDQVLRRSMIVANDFTHDLKLNFSTVNIEVSAHNTEQEKAEGIVEANIENGEAVIGFNGRYLRDVLAALTSESVEMEIRDELSPVLIRGKGQDDAKYVVMPMRI